MPGYRYFSFKINNRHGIGQSAEGLYSGFLGTCQLGLIAAAAAAKNEKTQCHVIEGF